MAKDRNGSIQEDTQEEEEKEKSSKKKSRRRKEESSSEESSTDSDDDRPRRSKKRKRTRRSSRRSSTSESGSESDSESEESLSESEARASEEGSEDEVKRKKRKERKRRKREEERERRRRKEKRKRIEREERRRKKDKDKTKKKKKKKKEKDSGKKGAVTNSWGKYGIIRETDMWNKRPEFTAWLSEVKQVNLETLPNWEEKQMFKEFMEDHNTATFPSKKYYNLDAYQHRKMEKEIKKGLKKVANSERTVFNDEEQRRVELMRVRERQKEEQVEALKCSMQSGMAQAMKEQARLKEEMAYQYRLGNFEAAAAIQKRLDPDVAM